MNSNTGNDILKTITNLHIDIRNLSPNVIKAWYDTDCKETKQLLDWMCSSLTQINYVPPLERAEYRELEQLDSDKCIEELAKLNPDYLSIFDVDKNLEETLLFQDEINYLEEENITLDKLIKVYENLDSNLALDLTYKTKKEINLQVECEKSQEACVDLAKTLDETNERLQERLLKYDPETHFVNFVNVKDYLNSFFVPLMEMDQTCLEKLDDHFSEELETCKKRILHSHQIYLANKIEIEKLKEVLEFLSTINLNDYLLSRKFENNDKNIEAKEIYKNKMCDVLDTIASKQADYYLKQTKIRYVEQELEGFYEKSKNLSNILENITQLLSYFILTNYVQFEEKKDVQCINNFYKKMVAYVNEDLDKCRNRTNQMRSVIEDYAIYRSKPAFERSKLITSIAKVLSSNELTLKSIFEAVGRFKTEITSLESQVFSVDLSEKEKVQRINENIKILQDFLISGPTNKVVLVPTELRNVLFEMDEHFKKASQSIAQAIQIPQKASKEFTKAQNYTRQLWMAFLASPSRLETILKQAEEDFKKRMAQYF